MTGETRQIAVHAVATDCTLECGGGGGAYIFVVHRRQKQLSYRKAYLSVPLENTQRGRVALIVAVIFVLPAASAVILRAIATPVTL